MISPRVAMVMAAGLGTRMGELTRDTPKPLLRVGGRALVDHALDAAERAGVRRAVVNLHYKREAMHAHLAPRRRPEIWFSDERDLLLETGGGVRHALPILGDRPFYVMNSDAVFLGPSPLAPLAAGWDEARMDALLLLAPVSSAIAYTRAGDFLLEPDGRLTRRGDRPSAPYVFTGAQIIRPEAFAETPEGPFSTNLVWNRILAEGRLCGVVHQGGWVDVGSPDGLAAAEAAMRAQKAG